MNMPRSKVPSVMDQNKQKSLEDVGIEKKHIGTNIEISVNFQKKNINGTNILVGSLSSYLNHGLAGESPIKKEYTDMEEFLSIVKDTLLAISTEMEC